MHTAVNTIQFDRARDRARAGLHVTGPVHRSSQPAHAQQLKTRQQLADLNVNSYWRRRGHGNTCTTTFRGGEREAGLLAW